MTNTSARGFTIDGEYGVFYRRVSDAEFQQWRQSGRLEPEPGGMDFGKHLTTTGKLARAWGRLFVEREWETTPGRVLEVRLALSVAQQINYVGSNTDGIGPCYFATLEQLAGARIASYNIWTRVQMAATRVVSRFFGSGRQNDGVEP